MLVMLDHFSHYFHVLNGTSSEQILLSLVPVDLDLQHMGSCQGLSAPPEFQCTESPWLDQFVIVQGREGNCGHMLDRRNVSGHEAMLMYPSSLCWRFGQDSTVLRSLEG